MRTFKIVLVAFLILFGNVSLEKREPHLRQALEPITTAYIVVKAVCLAYTAIKILFGTTRTTTFTEIATKKGFKYFDSSTLTELLYQIKEDDMLHVRDMMGKILGMSTDAESMLDDTFNDIMSGEENIWMEYDLFYNKEKLEKGTISYCSIFSRFDSDSDTYNLILVHMNGSFKLSDDLRAVTNKLKVGVVYGSEDTHLEYVPRGMEKSDVEALFYFFKLISYKKIAERFGMTLTYPDIEPKN